MYKNKKRIAFLLALVMWISVFATIPGQEIPFGTEDYLVENRRTTPPAIGGDLTHQTVTDSMLFTSPPQLEVKEAVFTVERGTLGQPPIVEPTVVTFHEGENVAQALVRVLGEGNYDSTGEPESGFYLSQVLLKDKLPMNIPEELYQFAESGGQQREDFYENDDEWLGEFDHSFFSGWIYWVNHVNVPVGMSGAPLEAGDVVRLQFTTYGYGCDLGLGDSSWGFGTPGYTVANKDELIYELAYINKNKGILVGYPALQQIYDKGNELVANLVATQKEVDETVGILKLLVDRVPTQKDKLYAALEASKKFIENKYTQASWEHFQQALTKAQQVYDDLAATQQQINESTKHLQQAMEGLVKEVTDYRKALYDTLETMYRKVPEPTLGTTAGEWTVMSLARGGYEYPQSYRDGYTKRIEEIMIEKKGVLHRRKYTEYSRLTLALTAIGYDVTDVAGYNLLEYLADYEKVVWQGINGAIYGLIALDAYDYEIPIAPNGQDTTTRQKLIDHILSKELENGGFALNGSQADVDVTGMALQALAPYKAQPLVKEAIDRTIHKLSTMQTPTGGFENAFGGSSGGSAETAESTAQVIVALCALEIDPSTDTRFIKEGNTAIDNLLTYYVGGEGFKHVLDGGVDGIATDQAAYALVAYDRFAKGDRPLYDMTDVIKQPVDKTQLAQLITHCKNLQEEKYMSESWEQLQQVLDSVSVIYEDLEATQKQADEAVIKLQQAVDALVMKPVEKLEIVDGKVTVPESLEEKVYILNPQEAVGVDRVEVVIPPNQYNKVLVAINQQEAMPEIVAQKGEDTIVFKEGTHIVQDSEVELFGRINEPSYEVIQKIIQETLYPDSENEGSITVNKAYRFGDTEKMVFDQSISITFKGLAGKVAGYMDGTGTFYPIKKVTSEDETTGLQEWCIDKGDDLVIHTMHFTDFMVYEDEKQPDIIPPTENQYVTLSIDKLTIDKGYVITPVQVPFTPGESAWDVLKRELDQRGIPYEYEVAPQYGSVYVQSIDGDGEFDHGRWSGWMYNVNDWYPNYGASKYQLEAGDAIGWRYTTNLGKDLGIDNSEWETYPDGTLKNPLAGMIQGDLIDRGYPHKDYEYRVIEGVRLPRTALVSFEDEKEISAWALNAVKIASALQMIEGYEGKFNPTQQVTRAEFAKILVNALEIDLVTTYAGNFNDVEPDAWYTPYIETAYQKGMINGYGEAFKPHQTLTRQEMAVILYRALELEKMKEQVTLKDAKDVAPWASEAVQAMYQLSLMSGLEKNFYPQVEVTREMAAVGLVNTYKYREGITDKGIDKEVRDALNQTTEKMIERVKEPMVGTIGGEWAIFGLARRGAQVPEGYYEDYYKRVKEYVKNEESKTSRKWKTKVTHTQRVAIALTAIGKDPTNVSGINLIDYSWNKEKNMSDLNEHDRILGNRQGLNELVFGLIAMDLQASTQPIDATVSRDEIIRRILTLYRTVDGGFNLRENEFKADVDMTAMTLQALAPYYEVEGYEIVTQAIDKALDTLSDLQREDGSFENEFGGADGGNAATAESTAQVIVALCSLGMNPDTDKRFIKNGLSPIDDLMSYYVEGGGFKHLKEGGIDQMATEQAYYALVAYERFVNGEAPIYYMLDVKEVEH